MLFPGHFCLGSFQSWSFLHRDVSALGHFSPVSLWSCHYGPVIMVQSHLGLHVISAMGHFGPWSFLSLVIWLGHSSPWSFRPCDISVPGHFSPVTFWSLIILSLCHFGPWSFRSLGHFSVVKFWSQVNEVILVPGHIDPGSFWFCHFSPRTFCPLSFRLVTFRSLDISAPGYFSLVILFLGCFSLGSFQSLVILGIGHLGNLILGSFLPGFISILVISAPGNFCSWSFRSCHFGTVI